MSTILVGTDGSAGARAATRVALELAKARGDDVLFVTAWRELRGDFYLPLAKLYPGLVEVEREWAQNMLARATAAAEAAGVEATTLSRHGGAADEICAVARERHARMIVIGSRGWGPIEGALFGSVSSAILNHAPCPVLAVPVSGRPQKLELSPSSAGTGAGEE
jgi:nucleotide-binding universal stress UspA family protein